MSGFKIYLDLGSCKVSRRKSAIFLGEVEVNQVTRRHFHIGLL